MAPPKRGRKSIAEMLTVVEGDFGKHRRPDPPEELDDHQADIWRAVVLSEAVDFFDSAVLKETLADYCRHKASANLLSGTISAFKPEWLRLADGASRYKSLLNMREKEVRAANACARSLRLTNQSRYTPKTAASEARRAVKGARPWEE
jgi:hypothetical protein